MIIQPQKNSKQSQTVGMSGVYISVSYVYMFLANNTPYKMWVSFPVNIG